MKRVTNYQILKESFEDMCKARRMNASLEITFRDRSGSHLHKIGAGTSDEIHVFREGITTFVLSRNYGLGYFGLEAFNGREKIGEIFIENHQVTETIERDDLDPINVVKRLADYLQ